MSRVCFRRRAIACIDRKSLLTAALFSASLILITTDVLTKQLIGNFHSSRVRVVGIENVNLVAPVTLAQKTVDGRNLSTTVGLMHRRLHGGRLFPVNKPFVLLSIDYHASPVQDLIDLLGPLGVKFLEKGIMTYGCQYFNSCASTGNWFIDQYVRYAFHWFTDDRWTEAFYQLYQDDRDFKRADAFLCFHPAATCQLFLPFGKPIIVLSTIRVDNGRMSPWSRRRWLDTLTTRIANNTRNVVAANNRFDIEYTKYFTGIQSVDLLPSYCGYTHAKYHPKRPGFLLYRPSRADAFTSYFIDEWNAACSALRNKTEASSLTTSSSSSAKSKAPSAGCSEDLLVTVSQAYPTGHQWSDLASHRGIVSIPLQPSMMALFEQYRMNVPLFLPSLRLLVEWQLSGLNVFSEMNLYGTAGQLFEADASRRHVPHPYSSDNSSLWHWMKLADWYDGGALRPHVYHYDSIWHLATMLTELTDKDLAATSDAMRRYNKSFRAKLLNKWKNVLFRVAGSVTNIDV